MSSELPERLRGKTRLTRVKASEYLGVAWGVKRAPATLARYACRGGGPRFRTNGHDVQYDRADLDRWAQALLSEPVDSTAMAVRSKRVTP